MRLFLALLCSILFAAPAYAEPALARFDQLLKDNGIPVDGVSGSVTIQGAKPANLRIDFKAAATQPQRDQAATLANSFDWLDKTDPNPTGFIIACNNDGTIPGAQRQNLNIMALWFRAGEKQIALNVWTLIKAALSGNAAAISAIQSHATANNITLP